MASLKHALCFLPVVFVRQVPYIDLFSSASKQAVDLLEGLLVFDPPGRLSVDVALDHPYFQPLR